MDFKSFIRYLRTEFRDREISGKSNESNFIGICIAKPLNLRLSKMLDNVPSEILGNCILPFKTLMGFGDVQYLISCHHFGAYCFCYRGTHLF